MKINENPELRLPWEDFMFNPYIDNREIATTPNDPYVRHPSRVSRFRGLLESVGVTGKTLTRVAEPEKGKIGKLDVTEIFRGPWSLKPNVSGDPKFTGAIPDILAETRWYLRTDASKKPWIVNSQLPPYFMRDLFSTLPYSYQVDYNILQPKDLRGVTHLTRRIDMYDVVTRCVPFLSNIFHALQDINTSLLLEAERIIGQNYREDEIRMHKYPPLWVNKDSAFESTRESRYSEQFVQLDLWIECAHACYERLYDSISAMFVPVTVSEQAINNGKLSVVMTGSNIAPGMKLLESIDFSAPDVMLVSMYERKFPEFLGLLALSSEIHDVFLMRNLYQLPPIREILGKMALFMENFLGCLQAQYLILFKGTHLHSGIGGIFANMSMRSDVYSTARDGNIYKSDAASMIQHWALHEEIPVYDECDVREMRVSFPFRGMKYVRRMRPGKWDAAYTYWNRFFREVRNNAYYPQLYKIDPETILYILLLSGICSDQAVKLWLRDGIPRGIGGKSITRRASVHTWSLGVREYITDQDKEFTYNPRS